MYKRILAVLLSLVLAVSLTPSTFANVVIDEETSAAATLEDAGQTNPESAATGISASLGSGGIAPASLAGEGSVKIEPIEDKVARIVVNDPNAPNSVDWGNEPQVITIKASDGPKDDPAVTKAPDTSTKNLEYEAVCYPRDMMEVKLDGLKGNILVLTPKGITGTVEVTVTARNKITGDFDQTNFKVDIIRYEDTGEYEWGEMPLPGSGFTSGIQFHPFFENRLYARIDVGGAYRFNFDTDKWECITTWSGGQYSLSDNGVVGIAFDPLEADHVYLLSGGYIYKSTNRGDTFERLNSTAISGALSSNGAGRGLGERIAVLPGGNEIWVGTDSSGVQRSLDGGKTFTQIQLRPRNGGRNENSNETRIAFIKYDPLNPEFMIVSAAGINGGPSTGTNGQGNPTYSERLRGPSIYYTERRSATNSELGYTGNNPNSDAVFKILPHQPALPVPEDQWPEFGTTTGFPKFGYAGWRSDFSRFVVDETTGERYFFVTYTDNEANAGWPAHELHMEGGSGRDGAVFRYSVDKNGKLMPDKATNITPTRVEGVNIRASRMRLDNNSTDANQNKERYRQHGTPMASVSVCATIPGALIVTTHNTDSTASNPLDYKRQYEHVFRSLDYGETWFPVLGGFDMFGVLGENGRLQVSPHQSPIYTSTKNVGGVNPYYPDEDFKYYNPLNKGATLAWQEAWSGYVMWMSSAVINPFNPDHMLHNSGGGAYQTLNLTALDEIGKVHAVPHLKDPYNGDETLGFFKSVGDDGVAGRNDAPRALIDYVPERKIESKYEKFLISGGDGTATRENSVKWDGTRGINCSVPKKGVLFSPPSGDFILYGGQGDLASASYKAVNVPVEKSMGHSSKALPNVVPELSKDRLIRYAGSNSVAIDYLDGDPDIVVTAVRGEWHWNASNGVYISFDGTEQFYQLPDGWEGTEELPGGIPRNSYVRQEYQTLGIGEGLPDTLKNELITLKTSDATRNPGWVAMSADGKAILWQVGIGTDSEPNPSDMRINRVIRTTDYGQTWHRTKFWDNDAGTTAASGTTSVKIYADRVNPDVLYAFENGQARVYISTDKGLNFYRKTISGAITAQDAANWAINHFQNNYMTFNGLVGTEGVFFVGGNNRGYFRIDFDTADKEDPSTWTAVSVRLAPGTASDGKPSTMRAGYGIGPNGSFDKENVILYTYGTKTVVDGNQQTGSGIWRSTDNGATWRKISPSTDYPNALDIRNEIYGTTDEVQGDARTFGRVYRAMGGYGIRYGDIVVNLLKAPDTEKAALDRVIEEAEKFLDTAIIGNGEGECTQEAYDNLKALVSDAHNIILNEDATQGEIDKMLEDLQKALSESVNTVKHVTGVSLDNEELVLTVGDTAKLTATVEPEDATNKNVVWTSSNDEVATVDGEGNIEAIAPGTATITVITEDSEFTATCEVTVNAQYVAVESVKIDGAAIQQLRIRNTKQFTATVNPTNATDQLVTWESSNPKIFTVDEEGLVKGVGTGSAKLIATCGDKTSFIMVQVTA